MFELKYFAKIKAFEKAEQTDINPQPPSPFDIKVLGSDNIRTRTQRELTRLFFLFAFWVLRAVWPVARIGRLVIVSRYADVCAVLRDHEHFPVPFGPEMKTVTGGAIFALGLDGKAHDAQRRIMECVVRPEDAKRILEHTRYVTRALINGSGGRIDVMRDLLGRVFTETCSEYFALDLDEPNGFLDRSMAITSMIFGDPFGTESIRRLALNGAVRVRYLIDRAVDAAKQRAEKDAARKAVIDRLVAYRHACGTQLSTEEIRAIVIGIMTGMVPTSTLGGGKIIEELQRRDLLQSAIGAASAAETCKESDPVAFKRHRKVLHDILFEALRLNPALSPGLFRYVPEATSISGTHVPADSVVLAGAMSALRDRRQFAHPGEFNEKRAWGPLPGVQPHSIPSTDPYPTTLMFGAGSHGCLAAYLAMEMLTEIFQILLSQDDIRFSTRPAGRLAYLGLFPRRLDMEFKPKVSPSTQHMVTIQAPIEPNNFDEVKKLIENLGNPAKLDSEIGRALTRTCVVHFASMSAFDAADREDPKAKQDPRLVLELNFDGDVDSALARIAAQAGRQLEPIFRKVKGSGDTPLIDLLRHHKVDLHFMPWGSIGLNFNGTPDCPVDDIEKQEKLAVFARKAIDQYLHAHKGVHTRAMDALTYVRRLTQPELSTQYSTAGFTLTEANTEEELRREGIELRSFLIRPSRRRLAISDWTGRDNTVGWPALLRSRVGLYLGLLISTTACLNGGAIHYASNPGSWISLTLALVGFLGGAVLLGVTLTKDGFGTLVRWCITAADKLAFLTALLLAIVALPAVLAGVGAAAYWTLERYGPAIAPVLRLGLAAVASVLATFAGGAILVWIGPRLRRYRYTATVALVASVAAFYVLPHFSAQLPAAWRYVSAAGAVAATILVRATWPWLARKLRSYRRIVGEGLALIVLLAVSYAVYVYFDLVSAGIVQLGALIVALGGGLVGTLIMWIVPILLFLAILYWHEQRDVVDERITPITRIREIAAKENPAGYAQNHITAVTPLKAGGFRKLTLALALWGIGKLVQYWFRPGFVLNMGTIHYARWFRLPGSEMLVFFSNYDGSWQSYLEDFVTKAHLGQSAAWSNGRGFPKTKLLIYDGAEDGDRFKRWVRRQQIVTQFWFSRYPQLTTDQIRCNALIHHGLMHAQTDTTARAWLDCFGTMQRPENAVETDEVQSLVFRGLVGHRYTICAAITFSDDIVERQTWLTQLQGEVEFGEQPDIADKPATFVGFSARGLEKCLHVDVSNDKDTTMATFPPAFQIGMAGRAKILGDSGLSGPAEWLWTDIDRPSKDDKAVDALLFIYGTTESACREVLAQHCALLRSAQVRTVATQPTERTIEALEELGRIAPARAQKAPMFEHFGFRDGISQPIIEGTQRDTAATDDAEGQANVVAAGEMILGYKDSSGHIAPAITLPAEWDGSDNLETDTPNFPSAFPRFGDSHSADLRDFGRNGTFVAVRQLKQDVTGFESFINRQENELSKYTGIQDSVGGPITAEWVAAKLMGRWRTGASLIRWPHAVASRPAPDVQDNGFRFGADDPQGLRCPLGAHIRRANPRGSLAPDDPMQLTIEKRHRLLRRGRPYQKGEGDQAEKGLVFVGLCADLERQFEFLQQSWIGSPNFHGLTNEPDPITALPGKKPHVFTIPTPSGPITMEGMQNFVTVVAGGYFFMPSRSAIRFLASGATQPLQQLLVS